MISEELKAKVEEWIAGDVDQEDIDYLTIRLKNAETGCEGSVCDLQKRFMGPLEFGTAGLRGEMGAGETMMNRAVVIKAAAGVASFANKQVDNPTAVIGYDARHNSRQFALDTAAVFEATGIHCCVMPEAWPTPVTSFALRHLNKDIAVMVTASHNPGKDNGYKVYLGGRIVTDQGQGAQIISPVDSDISTEIKKINRANEVPLAKDGWEILSKDILDAYFKAVSTPAAKLGDINTPVRVVTTAMHGVGGFVQEEALRRMGFSDIHHVDEQQEPNPDFPTVSFPNPEEAGALDLALKLATEKEADLIIANDPDADRCAMGAYDPHIGKYRQFMGDETGAIFGDFFAKEVKKQNGKYYDNDKPVLANSIVSSRLLEKIAKKNDLGYEPTLTGFKWVARIENEIFGYEEAIGYDVIPDYIRDKDGIGAGVLITKITQRAKAEGKTLSDILDDIAREYGLYSQRQVALRLDSKEKIESVVDKLRNNPPSQIDGAKVTETHDMNKGYIGLPPTNGIVVLCEDNTRIICRPSGTEPKVKFYIEIITDVDENASFEEMTEIRAKATEKLNRIDVFLRDFAG